jgi:hypothetical protein
MRKLFSARVIVSGSMNKFFLAVPITLTVVAIMAASGCSTSIKTKKSSLPAANAPAPELPTTGWHLTARPWRESGVTPEQYLDVLDGLCRYMAKQVNADGAVIDPFVHKEIQYSTAYFTAALATLLNAGRSPSLLYIGIRTMDHATAGVAIGRDGVPDKHAEFVIAPLTEAINLYAPLVPKETLDRWRKRMSVPLDRLIIANEFLNNWRAYAMRGQWERAQNGLVDRASATEFVEQSWAGSQRARIIGDRWNLYHDGQTDPQSHAVDFVGRVNLLGLLADGYDGPSASEMWKVVERGTRTSLLLVDPSGQCPPNGRAGDHVWNDVVCMLSFELMAEMAHQRSQNELAGQYRRAAAISFQSISRWRRTDPPWDGSFYITKNHFDPVLRVGYQPASNYSNYNGAVMLHLAEAYTAHRSTIAEVPSPVEIGGYTLQTDPAFSSVVADAGGMQVFANLRGESNLAYGHYWTTLGVVRFGRVGWDSRLGPGDGVRDAIDGRGVSFCPIWPENGKWVRIADVPDRYEAHFSEQFAHPLLVRCSLEYVPRAGHTGPTFRHEFVLTPDGVCCTLSTNDGVPFGTVWPILENDGAPLIVQKGTDFAGFSFGPASDEQCYLAIGRHVVLDDSAPPVRGAYGWLRPVRMTMNGPACATFVYPRNAGDPSVREVRNSLRVTPTGFSSILGRVDGTLYVGRTSAGGFGDRIDLSNDGHSEILFDHACNFIAQLSNGTIVAVETDRDVQLTLNGRLQGLKSHVPFRCVP